MRLTGIFRASAEAAGEWVRIDRARPFCKEEFDRPYGLTHSDKETGFLPNLSVTTRLFVKNPVSGPLCDRPYEKTTRPIPDSICL